LTGSVFAISGSTILGDGQVALIMDCNALIQ
jgi:two-component system, chemotaxis family, sensor kinase CheA